MRLIERSLVLAGLLGLAAARPAIAQMIRGRVVETTAGVAVGGGFVVLVGMNGKEVTRTLTDREGRFSLRAPLPGRYRLRSERIGFRMTLSEPFELAAGEVVDQELGVKAVPIRLDEVKITVGESQCKVKPEEGRATATVWEEARKALAAVAWSQRQQLLRATIRTFERDIETDLTIKSESTQTKSGFTTRPFRARSAVQLANEGYVTETPDTSYMFYAPDADVLFSEEFLTTHCLRLQAPETGNLGRIGLAFEPVGRRPVSDIRGVMWLDEKSGELEVVEFTYVNARLPGETDRAGGRVEFQQMVNGIWLVDYWYIRMPLFGLVDRSEVASLSVQMGSASRRVSTGATNQRQSVDVVGFREEGGELMDVFDRDGQRLAGTAGATLSGSIFDSTRSIPLADATLRIVGTGRTTKTGPGGTFRLDRLPEGTYQIEFFHDDHPAWGVLRPGVTAELKRSLVTETRLAVPPAERLLAQLCPGMPADSALGVAGGSVTGIETGVAVPNANVQVTWQNYGGVINSERAMVTAATSGIQTRTNESGHFRLCGVPADQMLVAEIVIGQKKSPPVEFRVGKRELKELNLVVAKP